MSEDQDQWVEALVELNGALEQCKDAGVTKADVLNEVDNVYGQ